MHVRRTTSAPRDGGVAPSPRTRRRTACLSSTRGSRAPPPLRAPRGFLAKRAPAPVRDANVGAAGSTSATKLTGTTTSEKLFPASETTGATRAAALKREASPAQKNSASVRSREIVARWTQTPSRPTSHGFMMRGCHWEAVALQTPQGRLLFRTAHRCHGCADR